MYIQTPKQYVRRQTNNGLLDLNNIRVEVNELGDGYTIKAVNDADFAGSKEWNNPDPSLGSWQEGYTLTDLLSDGYKPYDKWYNKPRPFLDNAADELKSNGELGDVFMEALKKYF